MIIQKTLKKLKSHKTLILYLTICLVMPLAITNVVLAGHTTSAGHVDNPNIPNSPEYHEHIVLDQCPANDSSGGQTLHYLYFHPAVINSPGGSGSTRIYGTTVVCSNNQYNHARNIEIFTTGNVVRFNGTGDVSLANTYNVPDINSYHNFGGPVDGNATFTNLSAGYNCWDVEYDAQATHNGVVSNLPGTAWIPLCVYYEPPPPPDRPYSIQTTRTYGSGSGTPFPNGQGGVSSICGTDYASNPTGVGGLTGPCTVSASAVVSYSGATFDRVGYTMCYDRNDCHFSSRINSSSVTVNLAGPTPGRYASIVWHYQERDRPPTITATADCDNRLVRIQVNDPNPGTALVGYAIDGGSESWRFSNDFTIDMSLYNQFDPHTVQARTQGVAPAGSLPGGFVSTSVLYGLSPTRGCLDRGFVATPTASLPILNPDDENPTSVTYNTGIDLSMTPSGGVGVRLNVSRVAFIVRTSGVIVPITGLSPVTDTRIFPPGITNYPTQTLTFPAALLIPPLKAGDRVCVTVNVSPGAGIVDNSGTVITATDPGNNITQCTTIVDKPYFQIFNGDVSAGSGFSTNSCAPTNARVRGFGRVNGSDYSGAGSQLGVHARGQIEEFFSASLRTVSPSPPKGISFANKGNVVANSTYGGGSEDNFCIPNYWANVPASTNLGNIFSVNGPGDGTFLSSPGAGTATLLGSNNVRGKKVVYVNGDLRIMGDVLYGGGTWGTLANIPNLYVIVRGNIYIDPSVSQLDGVYMAIPSASPASGHFYTCGLGGGAPSAIVVTSVCENNRLTINGQIIARQIHLLRITDSLRDSSPRNLSTSSRAAEIFIESPEVWLSAPVNPIIDTTSYESISNLPPVL
jgi:hypothetical protein